jgi:hypothetical protein
MPSRRSILHLGLGAAATLAASPAAAAAAYFGSPRGGGIVTTIDEQARSFTCVRRNRSWTYHTTERTRYLVGTAHGSWADLKVGAVVQLTWHRSHHQRVADTVRIRNPKRH